MTVTMTVVEKIVEVFVVQYDDGSTREFADEDAAFAKFASLKLGSFVNEYGDVVVDSVSHLVEACRDVVIAHDHFRTRSMSPVEKPRAAGGLPAAWWNAKT